MYKKIKPISSYEKKLDSGDNIIVNIVPEVSYINTIELVLFANIVIFIFQYILFFLNMSIALYLFILVIIVINYSVYYLHKKKLLKLELYDETIGTINSTWIDQYTGPGISVLCLKVSYSYKYHDNQFTSDKISAFENFSCFNNLDKVLKMAEKYTDRFTAVWINPNKPEESVLEKAANRKYVNMQYLILLFIFLHLLNGIGFFITTFFGLV